MLKNEMIKKLVVLPDDYRLVKTATELRNRRPVVIQRYQKAGKLSYNGPRITAVFEGDRLVSLNNLAVVPKGKLPDEEVAKQNASAFFKQVDPNDAKKLSFLWIEQQTREFITTDGQTNEFSVLWIEFSHRDGSYDWITLGGGGTLIELERDSRWDYFRGRRKTEMWNNDDWVRARQGLGPQLPSPNTLA
ncbi:hypothetical protein [Enterococcus sp. CSURQ0835]|uniref:hypothetical protein n=1 Tax=Enterococcus sp. CSURQ0835 TaxID=2681394 RepID=UPI00135C298A|nr:hypothetical protein [Enterococcus sp. CSURQ0835]